MKCSACTIWLAVFSRTCARAAIAFTPLSGFCVSLSLVALHGYEDVNDAERLALDPVMRQIVGGRAVDEQAASASQMGRFETEVLAVNDNRAAICRDSGLTRCMTAKG